MSRDRRSEARVRINYTVWLDLDDEPDLVPCTLLDISAGGARLKQPDRPVPDCFTIRLSATAGAYRFCLVTWRSAGQIGVQFMDQLKAGLR